MHPYTRFGITVVFLSTLFVLSHLSITGYVTTEQTERLVIVLKAQQETTNTITGAATSTSETEAVVITKETITNAQEQVLDDVNDPGLIAQIFNIETEPQVTAERQLDNMPVMVVTATPDGIKQLEQHPLVDAIYPNIHFSLTLASSTPYINADDIHTLTENGQNITGTGYTTCVLDSGITPTHTALANRIVDQKCYCTTGCCTGSTESDIAIDTHPTSHGTHVTGIIASNDTTYTGIAPNSNVISVKVCDTTCTLADIYAGINYCINVSQTHNVKVISGSFGDLGSYDTQETCPTYFDTAINTAYEQGIMSVFAAGNSGFTTGINYPACSPNATAVGAITLTDTIAGFSNKGTLLDILAPGVSITSTISTGYGALSGTSQATPHVSGAIILLYHYAQQKGLNITTEDIKNALATGLTIESWPKLDLLSAIEYLNSTNTTNTTNETWTITTNPQNNTYLWTGNHTINATSNQNNTQYAWIQNDTIIGNESTLNITLEIGTHNITLNTTNGTENKTTTITIHAINPTICAIDADMNEDGNITIADLQTILDQKTTNQTICTTSATNPTCYIEIDANNDSTYNLGDLILLYNSFNTTNITNILGQQCEEDT